jgi:ribosomal protein S18 acetylase RimI-like enzyme
MIRSLDASDLAALRVLRREALEAHPLAFSSSVEEDRLLDSALDPSLFFDSETSLIFGAFVHTALVGMVGVYRESPSKMRHRARIWGMYVREGARRAGLGTGLLEAALGSVRDWPGVVQVHLSVSDVATAALALYKRAGFRVWGSEPGSLAWQNQVAMEHHMSLKLDGEAPWQKEP